MATSATWNDANLSNIGAFDDNDLYSRQAGRHFDGERAAELLGRVILGGYFLYNGINHWRNREMMSGYARSKGIPSADTAVAGTGLMLALGGLSLLFGVKPKAGAALIAAFLAGVTPTMHAFWKDEDPQEKANNQINFMKNMALLGAASLAAGALEGRGHSA